MQPQTLTVSSVGQITLPSSVRKMLGLKPGTKLNLTVSKNKNSIILKRQKTFDEIMSEIAKNNQKYQAKINSNAKNKTAGEMSLAEIKNIKGDTWV